jgi:hypothetical protein
MVGLKKFINPLLYIFMFVVVLFIVAATALLSWSWVKGIDSMKENHPDYKGDDFLHTSAGRDHWDDWDDNTVHAEGDF